jgi:hypothetical protein
VKKKSRLTTSNFVYYQVVDHSDRRMMVGVQSAPKVMGGRPRLTTLILLSDLYFLMSLDSGSAGERGSCDSGAEEKKVDGIPTQLVSYMRWSRLASTMTWPVHELGRRRGPDVVFGMVRGFGTQDLATLSCRLSILARSLVLVRDLDQPNMVHAWRAGKNC